MDCFFFFQAEDGIRDLVRSRGLGDVYKRQVYALLGGGSTRSDTGFTVSRLDVGGELALLQQRLSFDLNVPLLYHTNLLPPMDPTTSSSGVAFGDVSLGVRGVWGRFPRVW